MEIIKIIKWRWPKFKQELFAILYMSAFQLWWISHRYPLTLHSSWWNMVANISMSIFGIALFIFIFSFADVIAEGLPGKRRYKKTHAMSINHWITAIIMFNLIIFTAWYRDSYHMSNMQYALCYLNSIIGVALFYRAMYRKPTVCS